MGLKHRSRLLWVALAVNLLSTQLPAADERQLFHDLTEKWKSERTAIVTAHIKFRFIRTGARLAPLSPDKVQQILDQLNLPTNRKDLKVLNDRLATEPSKLDAPWAESEFFLDGQKTREVHLMDAEKGKRVLETVDTGREQVSNNSINKQINIYRANSPFHGITLDDLRFVPTISDLAKAGYKLGDRQRGRVVLRSGATELTVDESSGFVHSLNLVVRQGQYVRHVRQFGPVEYAGGVTFPTAYVNTVYRRGTLAQLTAVVVETADINQEIASNAFQVAAEKGTIVVDSTQDIHHPRVERLREPVGDVVARWRHQRVTPAATLSNRLVTITWVVIVAALVIFLVWFFRSRSASAAD